MIRTGWTVLPLLLVLPFGCKSTEEKDYFAGITSDLGSMQEGLKDGIYKIDSVTKSLNQVAATRGDLRQPLSNLNSAIADLDGTTARIRALGNDLNAKEAAFQQTWQDEISGIENANMRRTAEIGRTDVDSSFQRLDAESSAVSNSYREWEAKVKSIQSSLQGDLSPDNVSALTARIKEVADAAGPLKERIRSLANGIDSLSASLGSTLP
jgi:uncharacterized protein YukE